MRHQIPSLWLFDQDESAITSWQVVNSALECVYHKIDKNGHAEFWCLIIFKHAFDCAKRQTGAILVKSLVCRECTHTHTHWLGVIDYD